MSILEWLARSDTYIRPTATRFLPPHLSTALYSASRKHYLARLTRDIPEALAVPSECARTLWGIRFRSPIGNAAGMYKNGEGYQLAAAQGAGFYLAGTTTGPARKGNTKHKVYLPFAPYPYSKSSSNFLGLPNDGDAAVAARLARVARVQGCPIGASVMGSPDLQGEEKLSTLIRGLETYAAAGVDFIEINESCPNTEDGPPQANELYTRLQRIAEAFLSTRKRTLPVMVKFSLDTETAQIKPLCEMLIELGFDGITLGNTSTRYAEHLSKVHEHDLALYKYFTSAFGGGIGGELVQETSLRLLQTTRTAIDELAPAQEFHIIRTGGVSSAQEVSASLAVGASLVQWYTGYFEAFGEQGHALYDNLYAEMLREESE